VADVSGWWPGRVGVDDPGTEHAGTAVALINRGEANYPLEPGPATLAMIAQGGSSSRIVLHLAGPRFGVAGRRPENDAVLWMRLWTLATG
jgi:hypothetical protein